MRSKNFRLQSLVLLVLLSCVTTFAQTTNGLLTVQIGTGGPPPLPLVNHSDTWRYRKGTNAPQSGWQTNADVALDASWLGGPGGFGYGDNDDATVLSDMPNNYTTVYIWRSFDVTSGVDTNRHLKLVMDYDDGFVAWLDGVEIARANAPGSPGVEPPFNAVATAGHEASGGDTAPNPPTTYDVGPAGNRLQPGTHVLAVQGLNAAANSSDLSLIADLTLEGDQAVGDGVFFSLVNTNVVLLTGSNTVPGSVRVAVNGEDAGFDSPQGTWSKTQTLSPGFNRLVIEALDAAGATLASTNKDIVVEELSTYVGGVLASNAVWDASMGVIRVTNDTIVPAGGTLSIEPGTVLLLAAGTSIHATNGSITVNAAAGNAVYFLPADGATVWGGLVAVGANGSLTLHHAETVAGRVEVLEGATGLVEDCYLHDYMVSSPAIIHALRGASLTLRRNHVQRYYEQLIQLTPVVIEDCLCENISGDGIDFDGAPPGSVIRRCTVRHGDISNVDGLDLGNYADGTPTRGVVIEDCLIYDFTFDKGVSIGEAAQDITVRNCVIYDVDSGVAVKDSSVATIYNNTIVDSNYGLHLYEKVAGQGGGHAAAYDNILWNNSANVSLDPLSTATVSYSDLSGAGVYPGTNNINADPLFLDPSARDYRLATNSPCIGTGLDGANIGALFPVGGVPLAPTSLVASLANGTNVALTWVDNSDNESGFEIQRTADGTNWMTVALTAADVTDYFDSGAGPDGYTYRVRADNVPGNSDFSNEAGATAPTLPVITLQPKSQTVAEGSDVVFTVRAIGPPPPAYQWRGGWIPGNIPGATNDTLVLTNVQSSMSGNVRVIVSNAAGSVMSDIAVLTVAPPPALGGADFDGTNVAFSFSSTSNLSYTVEYKNTLNDLEWSSLKTVTGDGSILTIVEPPTNSPSRFYRLRIE